MKHATNRSLLVLLLLALSVGCGPQESSQSSRPAQDSAEHNETTPTPDQPEDEPQDEYPPMVTMTPMTYRLDPDPINGEEVDSDESPTDVPENEEPEATDNDPTTPSDPVDDAPEVPILSECEEDYHFFADEVWPSVFEARCVGCHQSGSLAEDSRMVFTPNPTATQHLENFNAAWVMALYLEEYESLLLRKPSGRSVEPHGGGTLLSTSSREYALLQQWVQRAHDAVPCGDDDNPPTQSDPTDTIDPTEQTEYGDPTEDNDTGSEVEPLPTLSELAPGRRLLRRLSHAEYDASLRAILGESTDAAANLAADNVVNGYTNNADALTVSPLLAAQYAELAEELGLRVAYQNTNYQACVAVESAGTCFRNLLIELGTKLFRRPLKNEELTRYFDLWYGIAQEDGELEGTRWAFTALLQSPHFLYRAELGSQEDGEYKLSQYEIASQLAFNLTGLPPDTDLMDAARDGRLTTDNDRSIAATRLIQSAEGQAHFGRFLAAWLGLESIETVARNTSLYPEFTPGIRTDMLWQTLQTGSTWLERDVAFSALLQVRSLLSPIASPRSMGLMQQRPPPMPRACAKQPCPRITRRGFFRTARSSRPMRKPVHLHRFIEVSWYESAYSAKSSPHHHQTSIPRHPRSTLQRAPASGISNTRVIRLVAVAMTSSIRLALASSITMLSGDGALRTAFTQSTRVALFYTVQAATLNSTVYKSSPPIWLPVRMSRLVSSSSGASTSMDCIMMPHSNPQSMH